MGVEWECDHPFPLRRRPVYIVPLSELEQRTAWLSDDQPTQLPERANQPSSTKGLWIDPVWFLTLIDGLPLAHWACAMALLWGQRLRPALPAARHPGGAPKSIATRRCC